MNKKGMHTHFLKHYPVLCPNGAFLCLSDVR